MHAVGEGEYSVLGSPCHFFLPAPGVVGVRWVKTARIHMALQARPGTAVAQAGGKEVRSMIECDGRSGQGWARHQAPAPRQQGARPRGNVPVPPLRRPSAPRRPRIHQLAFFGAQAQAACGSERGHMPPLTRRCRPSPATGSGAPLLFPCCCSDPCSRAHARQRFGVSDGAGTCS